MIKYILKRILQMIPAILITSLLIFVGMNLTSGDVARTILGDRASEEQLQAKRVELGLDKPIIVQYFNYMAKLCTGDLGKSYINGKDVFTEFQSRFPNTLELAFTAILFASIISIPLGIYTAMHQNTWQDTAGMVAALFGVSMPNFWLGLLLILLFSVKLGWLPSGGKSGITSIILPAITVGLGQAAMIARTTRSSMLDVVRQDYIRTARAKGCPEHKVIYKHALGNAMIPIITAVGLQLSNILTGSVLAETVFSWPGIGRWIFDNISKRDTPMVTGGIIMCAIVMCIVNLLVDLVYAFFDPRIKAQYVKKG